MVVMVAMVIMVSMVTKVIMVALNIMVVIVRIILVAKGVMVVMVIMVLPGHHTDLTFKLDFTGNLCWADCTHCAAFAILAMFLFEEFVLKTDFKTRRNLQISGRCGPITK